jgi:hypothetical protein
MILSASGEINQFISQTWASRQAGLQSFLPSVNCGPLGLADVNARLFALHRLCHHNTARGGRASTWSHASSPGQALISYNFSILSMVAPSVRQNSVFPTIPQIKQAPHPILAYRLACLPDFQSCGGIRITRFRFPDNIYYLDYQNRPSIHAGFRVRGRYQVLSATKTGGHCLYFDCLLSQARKTQSATRPVKGPVLRAGYGRTSSGRHRAARAPGDEASVHRAPLGLQLLQHQPCTSGGASGLSIY